MDRVYPIACYSALSITDHMLYKYSAADTHWVGDKNNRRTVMNKLEGVPNDRILVLPLRVGPWKKLPDTFAIEICRACGGAILLKHEAAAFYQGDIRFSMPNIVSTAIIAHDVIKDRCKQDRGLRHKCR